MKEVKKIIFYFLLVKVSIFIVIICAFSLLPFSLASHNSNFLDPDYSSLSLASSFMTWDAQHYLFLSDHGYHPVQESNRFFPLFPGLIHLGSLFLGNSFWGGLVLSNLFSLGAIVLFYFFTKRFFSERIAEISTLLLLAFPTSFFLSLIYSESLFLFLVMCFFFFLYRKQFFLAGLFSFFLPLARSVGVFIFLPFSVYYAQYVYQQWKKNNAVRKDILLQGLHLLWPLAGLGMLFLFIYIKTGNFFEIFLLHNTVVGRWDVFSIFHPDVFFKNLTQFPLALHGFTNSLLDRIFFVAYLISLPFIYKRLDKTFFIYALCMGGVPIFGTFMSYTRYMLMVFPFFIILAMFFTKKKYSHLLFPFLFLLVMLQTLFIIMHSLNYWVA